MKKIFTSDLNVLIQLFAPKDYMVQIFDPFFKLVEDEEFNWSNGAADKTILINLSDEIHEYRGKLITDYEVVFNFEKCSTHTHKHHKCFAFLTDREKRVRWYFPKGKLTNVLPFYNNSGIRGKLISAAIKAIQFFKASNLVASGNFQILSQNPLKAETLSNIKNNQTYSIFTGARSKQRSAILALFEENRVTDFIKIPLTKISTQIVSQEKRVLNKLNESSLATFSIANDSSFHPSILKTKNLQLKSNKKTDRLTQQHVNTILELANKNVQIKRIEDTMFWEDSLDFLWHLRQAEDEKLTTLYSKIRGLKFLLNEDEMILTSSSHGDFTPWNILHSKTGLSLFDWELYSDSSTPLYDLFHFVYQRGILMRNDSSEQINKDLKNAFEKFPELQEYLNNYNIDFNTCHKLYLLKTASYFGALYANDDLTKQHKWQIETWTKSIESQLIEENKAKKRSVFIMKLNEYLQAFPHAFMKFNFNSINNVPVTSDLDIILNESNLTNLVNFCKNHAQAKISVRKKSFMTTIELFFENNEFLSLDFIHDFKRKGDRMLDVQSVLNHAKMSSKGVKVPELKHDLEYALLFYTLNNAPIPKKYWPFFDNENLLYKYEAIFYLNEKYGLDFDNMLELFQFKIPDVKRRILNAIQNSEMSSWNKFKLKVDYLVDTLKSAWFHPGFIITFSGVDGAGKSTIIEIVKKEISDKYRKEIVQLRHRPGILPMLNAYRVGTTKAEELATETLPRTGSNKSLLSSALRFTYYYMDYLLGQVYIYFKYIIRGKIVIYDRYYFDFITDPKRSNIQLNKSVVKALYSLILKPKLNFFLYANSEVILKRKKELDAETIDRLSASYKGLFTELNKSEKNSKYIALENIELPKTLKSVFSEFQKVA
ncbi:MAG: hypothetical protein ACPGEG_07135 [Salibacteraceae bacterium]